MNVCVLTAGEDEQLFANNLAQVRKFSNPSKLNQNENFDINEYKSDSEFSPKRYHLKISSFAKLQNPLHVSNTDELASGFDNMSFELDNSNINSNIVEVDLTSNLPDDIETTIDEDQEFSNEILNNSTYFELIRSSSSDEEFD
ncbi:hypothetical protein F8M41_023376 [Gigaspora margarita]|uniref:Uncharacterized protein n=1 Tax=Gigaspora margarita TaxID=4874 RepID=A0A8H4EHA0_GIGMA|nr:hypothetical protein F8M41_023376 [Gigaspora margarita]